MPANQSLGRALHGAERRHIRRLRLNWRTTSVPSGSRVTDGGAAQSSAQRASQYVIQRTFSRVCHSGEGYGPAALGRAFGARVWRAPGTASAQADATYGPPLRLELTVGRPPARWCGPVEPLAGIAVSVTVLSKEACADKAPRRLPRQSTAVLIRDRKRNVCGSPSWKVVVPKEPGPTQPSGTGDRAGCP